ncbi:MAG: hypothetical protein V3T17_18715 [Pseudomonadales bacterium]
MAIKPKRAAAKKKQPVAVETSLSIEAQTKAFLEAGGAIERINSGVSGQQSMAGPKHITLGNSNRPSKPQNN